MTPRFVVAPKAARDLAETWRSLFREAGEDAANKVIRERFTFLSEWPGAGHIREDLAKLMRIAR